MFRHGSQTNQQYDEHDLPVVAKRKGEIDLNTYIQMRIGCLHVCTSYTM
jgi:hypothetical protein